MENPVVLVVDDEPPVTRLCQRILEREGYQVLSAFSANEAISILARQAIDILLVDIRMPGLDGFQLLTMAKHQQPELATVVMTGLGTLENAIMALKRGANSLVLKPFSRQDLVDNVRHALAENHSRRELIRLRALQPLLVITERLFAVTGLEQLHNTLLEIAIDTLHCDCAGLYTPADKELPEKTDRGMDRSAGVITLGCSGDPDLLAVCERQAAAYWSEGFQAPYLLANQDRMISDGQSGPHLVLTVPIFPQREPVAGSKKGERAPFPLLLAVARRGQRRVFREVDREMLAILSRQAGLALDNAYLYQELYRSLEQVEKSQRMMVQAERFAAAGRLTASIAHEINNPLQAVNNCLHLALRSVAGTEMEASPAVHYLMMAKEELDRLLTTAQKLLMYYRPGMSGKEKTSVNQIIRRVLQLMAPQLQERGIQVEYCLDESLPEILLVPSQIHQVILNILMNAMEACEPGEGSVPKPDEAENGKIWVETRAGEFDVVEILIEDNGPGIPAHIEERLFEPLESTKESGTGLGLAVSYGIIVAHGGSLELVKDQIGPGDRVTGTGRKRGACFKITLPSLGAFNPPANM